MVIRNLARGFLPLLLVARVVAVSDHPLADAAEAQNDAAVARLLREHVDVNAAQGDGSTALHWAVQWNNREMAALLVAAGASVNVATDQGVTPIMLAVLNASEPLTKMLLDAGADANRASAVGETALMTAAQTGHTGVLELLLAKGAALDAAERTRGQTALMRAVAENHVDAVRLLLAKGASISARSKNRFTALMFAAQQGNAEIARLLLAAGADPNETAPDGIGGDTNARLLYKPNTEASALLVAIDSAPESEANFKLRRGDSGPVDHTETARARYESTAKLLMDAGADVNQHGTGRTPLHAAVQRALPGVVRALLARGADPNARLEKALPAVSRLGVPVEIGATPFWLAASYADVEIMRILVDAGADPNLVAKDKTTPLMVAAGLNYIEGMDKYGRRWFNDTQSPLLAAAIDAVKMCLDLGNDINAVNDEGDAAIFGAVYFGGTRMAQFLYDHGAKLDVKNKKGSTPWSLAQGRYNGSFVVQRETSDLLEKLGADTHLGKVDPEVILRQRQAAAPR